FFFFQAEDGIRDFHVTGVQTCALPISPEAIRNKTLTLFFDYVDAASWLAGSRKLDCMIGKGTDREGFAPIVGTAKGDILINGEAPVPPPNTGRSTPTPLPGAAPLPPQPRPR